MTTSDTRIVPADQPPVACDRRMHPHTPGSPSDERAWAERVLGSPHGFTAGELLQAAFTSCIGVFWASPAEWAAAAAALAAAQAEAGR